MPRVTLLATALVVCLGGASCAEMTEDDLRRAFGAPAPAAPTADQPDESDSAGARPRPSGPRPVERRSCPFDTSGYAVDCGAITLTDPDSGDLPVELVFARFSSDSATEPDPVIYLHGGPGGGVLEFADWYTSVVVDPFVADRDVILYDQRGAGVSSPLPSCREAWVLDDRFFATAEPHDEVEVDYVETLQRCAERLRDREGLDLGRYHTATHADDLRELIQALGYETVNLYGSSYGSRLAHTVLREHPEPIRSVILSGVYPAEVNLIGSVPDTFAAALDQLFAACSDDPVCGTELPDPWETFTTLVAALDAQPRRFSLGSGDDTSVPVVVAGDDLVNLVHGLLYSADGAALVPDLLIDLAAGDAGRLERVVQDGLYDTADVMPWLAALCHDEVPFATDDDRARAARRASVSDRVGLAPGLVGSIMYDVCPLFPGIGVAPDRENEAVVWAQPTLLFAGAFDPITPPEWAEAVAARLPSATLAHFPDRGHDADEGGCAASLMRRFVSDPTAALDLGCIPTTGPTLTNQPVTRVSPFAADLVAATFDIDPGLATEEIDLLLPDWPRDTYPTEVALWRELDGWDPVVVVIRSGRWDPDEVLWYVAPDVANAFATTAPPKGMSPRWERLVYDTSALDAVSYVIEEDGFALNVSIVALGSEIEMLDSMVLRPIVASIPLP